MTDLGQHRPFPYLRQFSQLTLPGRFAGTISAQFFGHTHYDEYEIFYDIRQQYVPNNVAYLAPSVTTFFDLNPGYRVYDVDEGHSKVCRLMDGEGGR